jgi:ABC-type Mn2+/Zn2+ transport system permease subunit
MHRGLTALALVACTAGCFGYNRSAKRWAYAGDTVLILGGGGAIAASLLTRSDPPPAMPGMEQPYEAPLSGGLVAGAVLVTAGVIGIVINATRPIVKSSR